MTEKNYEAKQPVATNLETDTDKYANFVKNRDRVGCINFLKSNPLIDFEEISLLFNKEDRSWITGIRNRRNDGWNPQNFIVGPPCFTS